MQELEYPFDGAMILQKKRALKRKLLEKDGLVPKKIAIMSGSTIGEIKNILELFLLDAGIRPEFYVGGYALYYENLMFDDGSLAAFAPDVIYIHTSAQNITDWPSSLTPRRPRRRSWRILTLALSRCGRRPRNSAAPSFRTTLSSPPTASWGISTPWTSTAACDSSMS